MQSIVFTVFEPVEILKHDIECFRVSTFSQAEELAVRVCPNGFPGIVFQHHQGKSVIQQIVTQTGRVVYTPTLFLHGQGTKLAVMHFMAPFTTIQVILKPFALKPLFGLDAATLTNNSMGPEAFEGEGLNAQLIAAPDDQGRLALLSDFLAARLKQAFARDPLIEASLDMIHRDICSSVTIESLLQQLNLSERQLERRFTQAVGISPQLYIRIRRVNEALKLMDTGQYERLVDVAFEKRCLAPLILVLLLVAWQIAHPLDHIAEPLRQLLLPLRIQLTPERLPR